MVSLMKHINISLHESGKDGESLVTKPGRLLGGGLSQVLLAEVSLGTIFLGDNLVTYVFNMWKIL